MLPSQPPSPFDEPNRPSRAPTLFLSAISKFPFINRRSHQRLSSSTGDSIIIPRSLEGFRFPSVVVDKTRPLYRIDQDYNFDQGYNNFTESPPVFIPNGEGLTAGFTFHPDSRSSVEKARSWRWARWRCKVRRIPRRVGRKLKRFGRRLRRKMKGGLWFDDGEAY